MTSGVRSAQAPGAAAESSAHEPRQLAQRGPAAGRRAGPCWRVVRRQRGAGGGPARPL